MSAFRSSRSASLRRMTAMLATVSGLALAGSAQAAGYVFDVLYTDGSAALASGSYDPNGTVLFDGDNFVWTITITNDRYWEVVSSDSFFPLMAFGVDEPGTRTGDYTLTLYDDLTEVFSQTVYSEVTQEVHLGTNGVTLDMGTTFDAMRLEFTLTSAIDLDDATPVSSTINGLLPIFGAPEQNQYSPGIVLAPVPEPGTQAMMLAGLLLLGAAARRASKS